MFEIPREYWSAGVGLAIGALAHFGRLISEGKRLSVLQSIGYLLQLGLIGLLSVVVASRTGITSAEGLALTAALLAMSAQEVVQVAKRRAFEKLREIAE